MRRVLFALRHARRWGRIAASGGFVRADHGHRPSGCGRRGGRFFPS